MNPQASPFELHLTIESEPRQVVECLAEASGLSQRCLKEAMTKGAVWQTRGPRTRRVRRASGAAHPGDTLHLYYDERILASECAPARLIADEGAYSVWFKPYGMRSQGSKWGDHGTLGRWSERHLQPQRPAFVVHRLDRAATGLMLLAHRKGTAGALSRAFRNREVEKRYLIVVQGAFPCGEEPRVIQEPIDGRAALSLARGLQHDPARRRTLVEVRIETGRKHQIRRHMAGLGFPVVGDRLHGAGQEPEDLQLTACELAFVCPEAGVRRAYALPEDLRPRLD